MRVQHSFWLKSDIKYEGFGHRWNVRAAQSRRNSSEIDFRTVIWSVHYCHCQCDTLRATHKYATIFSELNEYSKVLLPSEWLLLRIIRNFVLHTWSIHNSNLATARYSICLLCFLYIYNTNHNNKYFCLLTAASLRISKTFYRGKKITSSKSNATNSNDL